MARRLDDSEPAGEGAVVRVNRARGGISHSASATSRSPLAPVHRLEVFYIFEMPPLRFGKGCLP